MILLVIGWILAFIGVVAVDYTVCQFLDIVWAFWFQVVGIILYIIGAAYNNQN